MAVSRGRRLRRRLMAGGVLAYAAPPRRPLLGVWMAAPIHRYELYWFEARGEGLGRHLSVTLCDCRGL